MLLLVRNFVPAHEQIERGQWNVADVARNSFDLEGKVIGTVGAGVGHAGGGHRFDLLLISGVQRIGQRVLKRLVAFDPKELLYFDYAPMPAGPSTASFIPIAVLT
jgi:formate dehydrogenase